MKIVHHAQIPYTVSKPLEWKGDAASPGGAGASAVPGIHHLTLEELLNALQQLYDMPSVPPIAVVGSPHEDDDDPEAIEITWEEEV